MDALRVRVEELYRRVDALEQTQPAVIAVEVRELRADVADLRSEVRATKRALYTVALSVAGGAVTFAFTAFQIWGTAPG